MKEENRKEEIHSSLHFTRFDRRAENGDGKVLLGSLEE